MHSEFSLTTAAFLLSSTISGGSMIDQKECLALTDQTSLIIICVQLTELISAKIDAYWFWLLFPCVPSDWTTMAGLSQ